MSGVEGLEKESTLSILLVLVVAQSCPTLLQPHEL